MTKPIDVQIISENGKPRFAVLPIEQFEALLAMTDAEPTVPNEVVRKVFDEGLSPVRAWREHLGLTQGDLADRLKVNQTTIAGHEKLDANLRPRTLSRLAAAMGIVPAQLEF